MCKWIIRGFIAAYLAAVFLMLVGTFGWFGQPTDSLSGVFVVILGFPWTLLVDLAPERFWPILAALTPIANILILRGICRAISRT